MRVTALVGLALVAAAILAATASARRAAAILTCDGVWTDRARAREVPVRLRMPEGRSRVPVILFSHGLGDDLRSGARWAEAWARDGFAVLNLQHAGSDRSIIGSGRIGAAMTPAQLRARVVDVRFAIDELERRRSEGRCDLGRLDLSRIGMAGHSYGAHTTQAVAGQRFRAGRAGALREPRIDAAVALSPSPPFRGSSKEAFAEVTIPFLSITGTEDRVPFLPRITPESRTEPFRAMPPGGKYLLVLDGANHMTFGGHLEPVRRGPPPDARHLSAVVEASTQFWRWTLKGDGGARRSLDSFATRLGPGDRFERR